MSKPFAALLALMMCLPVNAEPVLPVEAFATPPDITNVRLSPDGGHLAYLHRISRDDFVGTVIQVLDIETKQSKTLGAAGIEDFVVKWIRWANDSQILMSAVFPAKRYGLPTTETRLLSIDIGTGEIRSVLGRAYFNRIKYVPQVQDQVIDYLRTDDDHILLELRTKQANETAALKVNIRNGRVSNVHRNKHNIVDWMTDRQERLRIAVWRKDTEYRILHRGVDSKKWERLWEFESFSEMQVWPMGFGKQSDTLYVSAYHDGRRAIFKVDLRDPNLDKELVFSHPRYDAAGSLIYSKRTDEVIGTRFSSNGGATFWDEGFKRFQESIDLGLPDTSNRIYDLDDSENRYVVLATSDTNPGEYYVGVRGENKLTRIARRYQALSPELMAEKSKVSYEARDGLEIQGFLTLPRDSDGQQLPTIVFPHGGPISFDDGGFDYWTQFFASQGYAVLQMNFRGSSGYGYDFMAAGLQSWGLAMQNDVEDGTRWLIEQGIADPDRVCVVGGSYGGYAALMEAARNPDLYQCAVSFAGVTDVAYLVSSYRRFSSYEIVKEMVGEDLKELKERSPLFLAEDIKIPVLLGHGTEDRSVRVQHSRRMHRALEKSGSDVTYLEMDDGDHYLTNGVHRLRFFTAMEEFLSTHLN